MYVYKGMSVQEFSMEINFNNVIEKIVMEFSIDINFDDAVENQKQNFSRLSRLCSINEKINKTLIRI